MPNITAKQKRFCEEYLIDFNAGAAYLRAGYKCSLTSAYASAHKLLRNAEIQAYLSELRATSSTAAHVTLQRVLKEVSAIAFARISDVVSFDADGLHIKDSKELSSEILAAIESTQINERTKSVKLHSKMAALNWLGQYFGIGTDFNQARASLKKYGLALVQDEASDLGWRLEKHVAD